MYNSQFTTQVLPHQVLTTRLFTIIFHVDVSQFITYTIYLLHIISITISSSSSMAVQVYIVYEFFYIFHIKGILLINHYSKWKFSNIFYRYYSMYRHVDRLAEEIKKGVDSVEGVDLYYFHNVKFIAYSVLCYLHL